MQRSKTSGGPSFCTLRNFQKKLRLWPVSVYLARSDGIDDGRVIPGNSGAVRATAGQSRMHIHARTVIDEAIRAALF
jgi:hypothetical protein